MNALRVRELTARGRGAIRVIEVSGAGAVERIAGLAGTPLSEPGSFCPTSLRGRAGELLDEALVVVHSSTCLELHLHGATATVERLVCELESSSPNVRDGAGSSSGLEERAEELLAVAPSEAAARMLLDQVQGALRRELLALLEHDGADRRRRALVLARRGHLARRLLVPPSLVLAGAANAGKSTLFNVLVGKERAVVDPAAGTTRDVVSERIRLGAHAFDLHDTAGERELVGSGEEAAVERAGQARAHELRRTADLTLWLLPPGENAPASPSSRVRLLGSRADENPGSSSGPWPVVSALQDPAHARSVVETLVTKALGLPLEPWTPGAGVPFEEAWITELESGSPAALAEHVRAWLEGGAVARGIDRTGSVE